MNAMTADQIELLSGKKTSQPKITMQANGVTFSFVGGMLLNALELYNIA